MVPNLPGDFTLRFADGSRSRARSSRLTLRVVAHAPSLDRHIGGRVGAIRLAFGPSFGHTWVAQAEFDRRSDPDVSHRFDRRGRQSRVSADKFVGGPQTQRSLQHFSTRPRSYPSWR